MCCLLLQSMSIMRRVGLDLLSTISGTPTDMARSALWLKIYVFSLVFYSRSQSHEHSIPQSFEYYIRGLCLIALGLCLIALLFFVLFLRRRSGCVCMCDFVFLHCIVLS
jgi:hypothetical protein